MWFCLNLKHPLISLRKGESMLLKLCFGENGKDSHFRIIPGILSVIYFEQFMCSTSDCVNTIQHCQQNGKFGYQNEKLSNN